MPKRKPRKTRPALNEQIRAARQAAEMTQRELADKMKVCQRFVCGLETGERTANVHHLIAICKAIGCEFPIDAKTVMVASTK